ncbi:hypothetical protein DY000_02005255 [Brassica cretica]|uniref:Uncharacterized protein n=1 Tax=Brassica cretica TaxID=69181 RepID=A0ABQ7BT37_BRACR|nr:hypothetical protein DY000_02005255 [Brassica cretica]
MASLTIRPEPVKQKKRPNYQINNNRYCAYCASKRDHQWPFELSRRPLGKPEDFAPPRSEQPPGTSEFTRDVKHIAEE